MEYTREQAEQMCKDWAESGCMLFANFIKHKFPQLPERGWVKSENGAIIFRTGKVTGYGSNHKGGWEISYEWSFIGLPKYWQPATEQEVITMLTEQGEKMGYVKGVKVKCLSDGKVYEISDCLDFQYCFEDGWLWNNSKGEQVKIMNEGKWAEIIADDLQERFDALVKEAKEKGKNVTVKFE